MRKKRSIVYVRPGKDVTLYVPAETPPEVIDYLNQLKQEGMFSQGVMDIVTKYVQEHAALNRYRTTEGHVSLNEPAEFPAALLSLPEEELMETADFQRDFPPSESDLESGMDSDLELERDASEVVAPSQKLDLAQIFRQAERNAGKLKSDSNG